MIKQDHNKLLDNLAMYPELCELIREHTGKKQWRAGSFSYVKSSGGLIYTFVLNSFKGMNETYKMSFYTNENGTELITVDFSTPGLNENYKIYYHLDKPCMIEKTACVSVSNEAGYNKSKKVDVRYYNADGKIAHQSTIYASNNYDTSYGRLEEYVLSYDQSKIYSRTYENKKEDFFVADRVDTNDFANGEIFYKPCSTFEEKTCQFYRDNESYQRTRFEKYHDVSSKSYIIKK